MIYERFLAVFVRCRWDFGANFAGWILKASGKGALGVNYKFSFCSYKFNYNTYLY